MSYGKNTSGTGEYNPTQRDPRLQGGQWDQPSTTGGYQDPSYTRDTGRGVGAETTQGRYTGEPGYGDKTTAQQHHFSRTDEPMRSDPALGRDPGIRGTGPGSTSTTAGTYPGEYGMEGHHFRHGESMAPLSTVPGTSLPATVGGDISRHEGRHEERKEARRERESGMAGYDEGPREEHKGRHHEGPFERHAERKELRTEEELGRGGMSRHEAHQASMGEPCMTNVPGTKYGGWEETRGGGLPKQQASTTTSYPGAGVTAHTETGAQSGRGIHAQQYERHPEHHLGERERRAEEYPTAERRAEEHLAAGRAEEHLAAAQRAEGDPGRQSLQGRQNLEAQQAARAGAGGVAAPGYGDTQRAGAGYGDTQPAGAGYGDTQRAGAGYGDTQRAGAGYGDTQPAGAARGDTQRADVGHGATQRVGDTGGPTGGKVSMTDKVIGGGEKLAGKMTSNTALYEQGTQRQHGMYEPQPKQ